MDFSLSTIGFLSLICFLAAIVRGYSGFGFSALLVLTSTWLLPPIKVVPMILMLEIIASIQLIPSVWAHIHWKKLTRLLVASIISLPFGIWGLSVIDEHSMRIIISSLIMLMSILLLKGISFKQYESPTLDYGTGFISGIANGLATIGGLTVVVVFLSLQLEAAVIRATLVALFFMTDLYATAVAWYLGLINQSLVILSLMMILPMYVGIKIGSRLFQSTSGASFRKVTLMLLIFLSLAGYVRYFIETY